MRTKKMNKKIWTKKKRIAMSKSNGFSIYMYVYLVHFYYPP